MMGLLSSIKSAAKKVLNVVSKLPVPQTAIGIVKGIKKDPSGKENIKTAMKGAAITAAVAGGLAYPAVVVGAAKLAYKHPLITGALATAVPIGAGYAVKNPVKTVKKAAEVPSSFAQYTGNLFELGQDPSVSKLLTTVKENPLWSAVSAGIPLLGLGAGVPLAINMATDKDKKKVIKETLPEPVTDNLPLTGTGEGKTPSPSPVPVTPVTKTVEAKQGGTKRRVRGKSKRGEPVINQKVNVIVSNRSSSVGIKSSRKYLNREVLAY